MNRKNICEICTLIGAEPVLWAFLYLLLLLQGYGGICVDEHYQFPNVLRFYAKQFQHR